MKIRCAEPILGTGQNKFQAEGTGLLHLKLVIQINLIKHMKIHKSIVERSW